MFSLLCAIPRRLYGFTETVLSGLGKGLVNDEVESVDVKLQVVWTSLKVLQELHGLGGLWLFPRHICLQEMALR